MRDEGCGDGSVNIYKNCIHRCTGMQARQDKNDYMSNPIPTYMHAMPGHQFGNNFLNKRPTDKVTCAVIVCPVFPAIVTSILALLSLHLCTLCICLQFCLMLYNSVLKVVSFKRSIWYVFMNGNTLGGLQKLLSQSSCMHNISSLHISRCMRLPITHAGIFNVSCTPV